MLGIPTQRLKNYNDLEPRRRVIRFFEDNENTFIDYPYNKEYLIDREDLGDFYYYNIILEKKCFYSGLVASSIMIFGMLYKFHSGKLSAYFFPFSAIPLPVCIGYHFFELARFLDYSEIKYQSRGLYDDELWEYHKKNSLRPFT